MPGHFEPLLFHQAKTINQIAVMVWLIVFILLFIILSIYSGFITAHIIKNEGARGLVQSFRAMWHSAEYQKTNAMHLPMWP